MKQETEWQDIFTMSCFFAANYKKMHPENLAKTFAKNHPKISKIHL